MAKVKGYTEQGSAHPNSCHINRACKQSTASESQAQLGASKPAFCTRVTRHIKLVIWLLSCFDVDNYWTFIQGNFLSLISLHSALWLLLTTSCPQNSTFMASSGHAPSILKLHNFVQEAITTDDSCYILWVKSFKLPERTSV